MTQERNPGSKERARENLSIKWMQETDAVLDSPEVEAKARALDPAAKLPSKTMTKEVTCVLEVDQESDSAYIRLRNFNVAQTVEVSTDVRVDLNDAGRIGGIEITSLNSHSALARVIETLFADSLQEESLGKVTEAIMSKPTMNVDELSVILGIGRRQAYEAVKRGEIPSIRLGKRILISTRVIDRILAGEPATD